jgi:cytochrome c-type biogenesis protein CcmF
LLHSAIVVEKREALKSWTILLAILAFGFSLLGTFIVRSGVLTSVHAFANDPARGVVILVILGIYVGGALTLYAVRAPVMEAKGAFAPVSREGALVVNNILLAVSAAVVFVGTIWPLVAELAFDRVLSVGPPFFNAAFTPFMVALALILPAGAMLAWKRGNLGRAGRATIPAILLALAVLGLAFGMMSGRGAGGPLGLALGAFVIAGALADLWARTGQGGLSRLWRLPRADWGKAAGHAGLGVMIIGIAGVMAWTVEDIRVAQVGDRFAVGSVEISLDSVEDQAGPNYQSTLARMTVWSGDRALAELTPEKRFYPVAAMPTTEAAILNGLWRDIYLVIGDAQTDGGWAVRTYVKPLANWIWGGAILMALGGLLSLSDRRLRVAAGARAARPVPAE